MAFPITVARGFVALAFAAVATVALAQEAPDAMVKRVSQEVLQIVKTDPLVQAGNEARIREVVEVKLLPNFDFTRMTALAMGRNWRAASPEQQQRLVDEFRTLLVRTYALSGLCAGVAGLVILAGLAMAAIRRRPSHT